MSQTGDSYFWCIYREIDSVIIKTKEHQQQNILQRPSDNDQEHLRQTLKTKTYEQPTVLEDFLKCNKWEFGGKSTRYLKFLIN